MASLTIPSIHSIQVIASPEQPVTLENSGDIFYYATEPPVSEATHDGEVAENGSLTLTGPKWLISKTQSVVSLVQSAGSAVDYNDVVTNNLTVAGTATLTGGMVAEGPGVWAGGYAPVTAETGTDTALAEKKLFVTSLYLPYNKKLKGIGYPLGAGGGTTRVIAALFSHTGAVLAHSTTTSEGTVGGTEKTIQSLAFTSEYAAVGPGKYFIGITGNGATTHIRTIPTNTAGENIQAAELSLAEKNVLASITPPTTFTGAKGVVAFVY